MSCVNGGWRGTTTPFSSDRTAPILVTSNKIDPINGRSDDIASPFSEEIKGSIGLPSLPYERWDTCCFSKGRPAFVRSLDYWKYRATREFLIAARDCFSRGKITKRH
jgi:hypothetical protein